jgi:hypothetical protein
VIAVMLEAEQTCETLVTITLMMEAVWTSEMFVNLYQPTWHYNPEDSHLYMPLIFLFLILFTFPVYSMVEHGFQAH